MGATYGAIEEPRVPMSGIHMGRRIRYLRAERGWSQRQLAARARVNPSTISRIERGARRIVTLAMADDLAVALGCGVDELFGVMHELRRPPAVGGASRGDAIRFRMHRALTETGLVDPPVGPPVPLSYASTEAHIAHTRRVGCDYRGATLAAAGALFGLQSHLRGPFRQDALALLTPLYFDACATLTATDDLGYAWIAAHRCQEIADATGNTDLTPVAQLAMAMVSMRQGCYDRTLALAATALNRAGDGSVAGMLHVTGALAAARCGSLTAEQAHRHFAAAARSAELGRPRSDVFGLGFDAAFVQQARFAYCIDRRDLAGANAELRAAHGQLSAAPANRSDFFVDLARYHLLRDEYHLSLDALTRAELIAPQRAHASPEADEVLDQLAVSVRTDALRRRVADVWQRFRRDP